MGELSLLFLSLNLVVWDMTHQDLILDIKGERPRKHAIYMRTELGNGQVLTDLRFIDGSLPLEAAQEEAIRIVKAQWAGAVKSCVCIPDPEE